MDSRRTDFKDGSQQENERWDEFEDNEAPAVTDMGMIGSKNDDLILVLQRKLVSVIA